jgi:hypothetical protein
MTPPSVSEIETPKPSVNWLGHSFSMKISFTGSVSVDRIILRMIELTT